MKYYPEVFSVRNVDEAKQIILTPDGVRNTDERWEAETPWLVDKIADWMPQRDATCLDYGCGIGRLAKPLIEQRGWSVIGVDISREMLRLAVEDIRRPDRFLACEPAALDTLLRFGTRFDFAVTTWVLQHCEKPQEDIDRFRAAIKPGGRLFVLNAWGDQRFVPVNEDGRFGWYNDGADIWKLLGECFVPLRGDPMPKELVPAGSAMWAIYERTCD